MNRSWWKGLNLVMLVAFAVAGLMYVTGAYAPKPDPTPEERDRTLAMATVFLVCIPTMLGVFFLFIARDYARKGVSRFVRNRLEEAIGRPGEEPNPTVLKHDIPIPEITKAEDRKRPVELHGGDGPGR